MDDYLAAMERDRRIADRRRMEQPRELARRYTAQLSPTDQYKLAVEMLAQVAQIWGFTRTHDSHAHELNHLLEALRGLGNGLM